MNKKGMEMSINVVVGIILGLAVFIAGIALFWNIMDKTNEADYKVSQQMMEKIRDSLDSGDAVATPITTVVPEKNSAVLWFGIRNTADDIAVFKYDVKTLNTALPQSRIVFLKDEQSLPAKEDEFYYAAVDTKGLASGQYNILINVSKKNGNSWEQYYTPKIISIDVK